MIQLNKVRLNMSAITEHPEIYLECNLVPLVKLTARVNPVPVIPVLSVLGNVVLTLSTDCWQQPNSSVLKSTVLFNFLCSANFGVVVLVVVLGLSRFNGGEGGALFGRTISRGMIYEHEKDLSLLF